jgi:RimJ/RimL family protein N-acetyltransferase
MAKEQQPKNPYWPLFDLVVRTPRLELRPPDDDMVLALAELGAAGIHDPDWMPFNIPWTDIGPPAQQRQTLQHHWRNRAEWTVDSWHLAFAVYDLTGGGEPGLVGVQGVGGAQFPLLRQLETGSWVGQAHQGRGIGREMRAAVLQLAFEGLGAQVMKTGAWHDNVPSLRVTRSLPYREDGSEMAKRRDDADRMLLFRMEREDWEPTRRDDIVIEGLEPCLEMFGLAPDRPPADR